MDLIVDKNELFNSVLLNPAGDANKLVIVSGFATPAMMEYQLEEIRKKFKRSIEIELLVGMTPTHGISPIHHKNFIKLCQRANLNCSYIRSKYPAIHSKLYVWTSNSQPAKAFLSSANYTVTGFLRNQRELAIECDSTRALKYYESLLKHSFYCHCEEAQECVNVHAPICSLDNLNKAQLKLSQESVLLPLFSEKRGEMHNGAGLNWGQRLGREPNQAYIPVPASTPKDFFPPRGQPFSVLTHDGFPFVCVRAQANGKAIETTLNNSELGEYFRKRLGVSFGERVELVDLDKFGSRYVKLTKIDNEEYFMEYEKGIELPDN